MARIAELLWTNHGSARGPSPSQQRRSYLGRSRRAANVVGEGSFWPKAEICRDGASRRPSEAKWTCHNRLRPTRSPPAPPGGDRLLCNLVRSRSGGGSSFILGFRRL